MNICGIKFKNTGKTYNFNLNDIDVKINDYVIVNTEKGEQFGQVISIEEVNVTKSLKDVIRVVTKNDYDKFLNNVQDSKKALIFAKDMAKKLDLRMQFIDASYTFDRKQLLFNFTADERIDFRELVKQLAGKFKTRIELHQIGVRDKAREVGGIGQCGRSLCCSKFLTNMDTISINMAKNQNIALNPSKINGSCGRLLCCLAYEDDYYSICRQSLPNIGEIVTHNNQNGKVIFVEILNQSYKIDINGEIKQIIIKNCKDCKKD